jgi:UPF0042 nucleotide-binding protein
VTAPVPSPESLVLIVTGLSGAGKSTALHALEDLGFFCVDNLPVPVMDATLVACEAAGLPRVAMGIDVRVRRFLDRAAEVIESVRVPGHREVDILFLDAADETLLRRFSSTRRPHPLIHDHGPESSRAIAVLDSIRVERERLSPLRARAKQVIDTSELSVHDLRRRVLEVYGPGAGAQPRMSTRVVSFGFKYGPPVDADLLLDVRFLPNPFFVAELRPLSGLDEPVQSFVLAAPDARTFLDKAVDLLSFSLPRYEREGKSYLTVGIGCTGGQHRSVVLAEKIAAEVSVETGLAITVVHRDIDRDLSIAGDSFVGGTSRRGAGLP